MCNETVKTTRQTTVENLTRKEISLVEQNVGGLKNGIRVEPNATLILQLAFHLDQH